MSGDDVFIGPSKEAMGIFKMSLHRSGVWVLAATQQSSASFDGGNRRAKRWTKPLEHTRGVTRGPSILVPHTSLGSRLLLPSDAAKSVVWFPGPAKGQTIEFSFYFVERAVATGWDADESVLVERQLARGDWVVVLASSRQTQADFAPTVEKLLHDNVLQMNKPSAFEGGSFLWFTESRDSLRVPIVVDLPVRVGPAP